MNSKPKIFLSFSRGENTTNLQTPEGSSKLINDRIREIFPDALLSDYTVESCPGVTVNKKIFAQLRSCYTLLALIEDASIYFSRRACVFELFAFILARPEYLGMAGFDEEEFHPTNFINVLGARSLRDDKAFIENWNLLVGWFRWIQNQFRLLPAISIQTRAGELVWLLQQGKSAKDIRDIVKLEIGYQSEEASSVLSSKDAPSLVTIEECSSVLRGLWDITLTKWELALAELPIIVYYSCANDPDGICEEFQHLAFSHECLSDRWAERRSQRNGGVCLFEICNEDCSSYIRTHIKHLIEADGWFYIIRLRSQEFYERLVLSARKRRASLLRYEVNNISSLGIEIKHRMRKIKIIGSNFGDLRRALDSTGLFSAATEESFNENFMKKRTNNKTL